MHGQPLDASPACNVLGSAKKACNGIEEDMFVNNRLGNILVKACRQKGFTVTGHRMSRQSNHGNTPQEWIGINAPQDFCPIHLRQRDVEEDEVWVVVLKSSQCLRTRFIGRDLIEVVEHGPEEQEIIRIIFDDGYLSHVPNALRCFSSMGAIRAKAASRSCSNPAIASRCSAIASRSMFPARACIVRMRRCPEVDFSECAARPTDSRSPSCRPTRTASSRFGVCSRKRARIRWASCIPPSLWRFARTVSSKSCPAVITPPLRTHHISCCLIQMDKVCTKDIASRATVFFQSE